MKPVWHFRTMDVNEINQNPIQGEFFNPELLKNAAASLIRESYQNTMDAVHKDEIAKIRIFFSGKKFALKPKEFQIFFDGIEQHLSAEDSGLFDPPNADEAMDYIVIEDFGTKGLGGKIDIIVDPETNPEFEDFYFFWRNIGRSGKSLTDVGRWGLGKTVFPMSSRINSFFGLTIRVEDNKQYLMGQSTLNMRFMDGHRYYPYGYFGIHQEGQPAMPINDNDFIRDFRERFNLSRTKEPGLSVIIPFPYNAITPEHVFISILTHYFFPILAGKLIVEINNEGKKLLLDQNNIESEIQIANFSESDEEKSRIAAMCELAIWSLTHPESEHYVTKLTGNDGRKPKWAPDLFNPEQLSSLQELFERGERIGIKVPFQIERINGEVANTSFLLYLQRNSEIDSGMSQFIRSGITISGIPGLDRKKGVMGFVLIEDRALSGLLGDAENPSHTEWRTQSKLLHKKYKRGPSVIWFVRNSLDSVVDLLSGTDNKEYPDLLREIFSVDLESAPEVQDTKQSKRGKTESEVPNVVISAVKMAIKLEQSADGFIIKPVSNNKKIMKSLNVILAYEVIRGNPLKKYSILDFDVSQKPICIESDGLNIINCSKNTIEAKIVKPDFMLKVNGFDTKRDLYVTVSVETEGDDDSKV